MLKFRQFLTEASDWHKEHPVNHMNIVQHYDEANATERAQGMNWYRQAHQVTKQIAKDTGISHETAVGLMANYSPQTEWHDNMMLASRVAKGKKAIGGKDQEAFQGKKAFAGEARRKAAEDILGGKHYSQVLKGHKVQHFAHLIEFGGDQDPKKPHVAIDRHAWSVAAGARMPDSAFSVPTKKKYNRMVGAYIHAANHINKRDRESAVPTGIRVKPHQLQAITWLVRQRKNNQEDIQSTLSTMKSKDSWLPGLEPTEKDLPSRMKVDKSRGGSTEAWKKYARQHHPQALGVFEERKSQAGILRPRKPGQAAYGVGGRKYETGIVKSLQRSGLMDPNLKPAGSSSDASDAILATRHGTHNLEVKQSSKAMFGQFELSHNGKKWVMSEKSRNKYPRTAAAIEAYGFLKDVNKKWKHPPSDYQRDLKQGNVWKDIKGTGPIAAHYNDDRKVPYMQVGGGGLYHLKRDRAGLGTTKLSGDTNLRARFKYRKTNMATGKVQYGALIVMNLKNPKKSSIDLDNKENLEKLSRHFGTYKIHKS